MLILDKFKSTIMKTMTRPLIETLSNGTLVKTTKPNQSKRTEWTDKGWNARKWGIKGEITDMHNSHGLYYDVKHEDGTNAGYDPSEIEITLFSKEDISVLTKMRDKIQSLLLKEDMEITFYNPFNKKLRKLRTAPDRYLICFAPSVEKRNVAYEKAVSNGYKCKMWKEYEKDGSEGEEKFWTFRVDLIS